MDYPDAARQPARMEYTKRRNINRGFMKLEAWQRAMDLFVLAFRWHDTLPQSINPIIHQSNNPPLPR
jgi:hypothetical protein